MLSWKINRQEPEKNGLFGLEFIYQQKKTENQPTYLRFRLKVNPDLNSILHLQ